MPIDLASASLMARDATRAQFGEGQPERPRRAPVRRAGARALRALAERVEP
jgi:hypothetical protein